MHDGAGTIRIGAIMAGGIGERFWPVSRPDRPKQLLPLGPTDSTLLADTAERFNGMIPVDRLLVVTSRALRAPIIASGLGVPDEQIIAEPAKRNTLGAIAWVTAHAMGRMDLPPENTTMAVMSSDQYVGDVAAFQQDIAVAFAAADELDALVNIGIEPTRPETGYGYVEVEETPDDILPGMDGTDRLHRVVSIREKPDAATAERFFRSGRYLWNAGMFFWRISTFMRELEAAQPEIAELVREMTAALADDDDATAESLFAKLPEISIDYALMEHAQNVMLVRASFPWDDVGAWDAWRRVVERDERGNATHGEPLLIDCDDCAVYNESGQDQMFVAVVGMERVIVAVTPDGLLVAPLDEAQKVREVVRRLREQQPDSGGSEQ